MTGSVRTRFAPAPSGLLHLGNARTAVLNWLFSRREDGEFLLRFDDTDTARVDAAYIAKAERDLSWLGLEWHTRHLQSERSAIYAAAIERLKASGHLYPCYETADELAARRASLVRSGQPPVYDRAALRLTADERRSLESHGRQPHWRLKLGDGALAWDDLIRGPCSFEPAAIGDPVVVREDGTPLYILASVVDDVDLAITHVIRGEDHVANTPVQIALFGALQAAVPLFGHHSLIVDDAGQRLSKRAGAQALAGLRDDGLEPRAVLAWLARVGTADTVAADMGPAEMAATLDFARFSRAPVHVDHAALDHANRQILSALPYADARPRLESMGVSGGEAFWLAVRPNLSRLADARLWWRVVSDVMPPAPGVSPEDADYLAMAAGLLPETLDGGAFDAWTRAIGQQSGRQGRALYGPLRLALTGRKDGPELRLLLSFLGSQRARRRLLGETA
ncbi:MAG: glutamate--tRNA ligase [Alphaproteobacteria bacterium]